MGQCEVSSGNKAVLEVSQVQIRVSGNATTYKSGGTYFSDDTFTYGVTGLTPARYYHYKTWASNSYSFNSSDDDGLLTRPNSTTNFRATNLTASGMELVWKNSSISDDINTHSVLIHYSTSSPDATPTPNNWGTEIANVSDHDNITISGLGEETTYYFVAWTYIEDSGSPTIGIFSSSSANNSLERSGNNRPGN